ncbi:MAG: hypothetical protein LBS60_05595 [Deltaproteobacteria bacterium]|jgi:flavodoxin|nr:hypothetical protein [Deltaproteobacteria bacterium]
MKTVLIGSLMVFLVGFLTARSAKAEGSGEATIGRALVAYFSLSGNSKTIALETYRLIGGDLFEIQTVKPYPERYNDQTDQAKIEQREQARPALKTHVADMGQYDLIVLVYPNWWSSIPMPVATFLEEYDLTGKTILPICSHGGGGLQGVRAITKSAPKAKVLTGLGIAAAGGRNLTGDLTAYLTKLGLTAQ